MWEEEKTEAVKGDGVAASRSFLVPHPSSFEFYPVSLQSVLLDLSKVSVSFSQEKFIQKGIFRLSGLKKFATLQPGIEKAA